MDTNILDILTRLFIADTDEDRYYPDSAVCPIVAELRKHLEATNQWDWEKHAKPVAENCPTCGNARALFGCFTGCGAPDTVSVVTESMLTAVVAELIKRGLYASTEHPGYITVSSPTVPLWLDCGTANGTWGIDLIDVDGQSVVESFESTLPADCSDVARIADWIACTYTEVET